MRGWFPITAIPAIPLRFRAIPAIPVILENPIRPNEISLGDGLFANAGSSSARYCSNRFVLVAGSSGSAGRLAKSHGSGKRAGETHGYGHGGLLRRSDNRPRRSAYSDRRQCTQSRGTSYPPRCRTRSRLPPHRANTGRVGDAGPSLLATNSRQERRATLKRSVCSFGKGSKIKYRR